MALIIGLTGGIASGKTTVANLFSHEFNIDIVDADIVAREVVAPGTDGLSEIVRRYGTSILTRDGALDRASLREKVFSNQAEKEWLNALLHPMIRHKMQDDLQQISSPYGLLVVPLLVENKLQYLANRILVVDVDVETQISRTMERDHVSREHVIAILNAQASREERLSHADDVVKNSAENQKLLPQITELHQKYLAMCQ